MKISLSQITSAVSISLCFIIISLLLPVKSFSVIATLYTQPSSGVTPLEVRLTCVVATNTSEPTSYTMDFGDGSEPITVETNSYSQTFTHTYQNGLFKPICRVDKNIGTNTDTDPGNLIVAKWKFKTNGEIDSSPAIGNDGTVYIGSDDGNLYAIDSQTGDELWRFKTGAEIKSVPSVGPDGIIYFGSLDNFFYALNQNGALKWSINIGDYIFSSPAVTSDGRTIYVGASDNKFYAINSSGNVKWTYQTGHKIVSSPAIGSDGIENVVYFGSLDRKFYALAADTGSLKWIFQGNAEFYSSPAIDDKGQIYVGECTTGSAETYNFKLFSINVDGSKLWQFNGGPGFYSSPAIGPNGKIYIGSWDGDFYILNSSGNTEYSVSTTPYDINSSPAIGANGVVYVGSEDGNFYAIDPTEDEVNSEAWTFKTGDGILESSPVIDEDGTIYFASRDKCVYAINPGNLKPADSPWPMFHQSPDRRGNSQSISIPAVISSSPAKNNTSVSINTETIAVNFSPDISDSQIDEDSFKMVKVNDDEDNEEIDGYASLDVVRYNNSGYHLSAIFERLDNDIPLKYNSKYKASISYSAEPDSLSFEKTFTINFTTQAVPETDPNPSPEPDFFSCFINTIHKLKEYPFSLFQ
jgi:outer membrane protein assembly factor BamB